MRCIEESGRNKEEAVEKALKQLEIELEEAAVEILEEGGGGVFRKPVKVRVSYASNCIVVRKVMQKMMEKIDVGIQVNVMEDEGGVFHCNLKTEGLDGLFIGKGGKTLDALQHILNRIVNREVPQTRVCLDIGGYKERHYDQLRKQAMELAQKVRDGKEEIVMDPLSSSERRIIHLSLQDDPEVRTYTIGEGEERSVVLAPRVLPIKKTLNQ
jgi:spoIIIJ-associated protein